MDCHKSLVDLFAACHSSSLLLPISGKFASFARRFFVTLVIFVLAIVFDH
jgi:hypothetical protein